MRNVDTADQESITMRFLSHLIFFIFSIALVPAMKLQEAKKYSVGKHGILFSEEVAGGREGVLGIIVI